MRNINRLRLSNGLDLTLGGGTGAQNFNQVDQVANDYGQPLKIVGIRAVITAPTITPASQYVVNCQISTTPKISGGGELYRWSTYFDNLAGTTHQAINENIGNMHDVLFELEKWDTELNARKNTVSSGSAKGEIYFNVQINSLVAVASVVKLRAFITLFYIV